MNYKYKERSKMNTVLQWHTTLFYKLSSLSTRGKSQGIGGGTEGEREVRGLRPPKVEDINIKT
jgi:hypothetical protein